MKFSFVAIFFLASSTFVFSACTHLLPKIDFAHFRDGLNKPAAGDPQVEALNQIQTAINQRKFTDAFAKAKNFQANYRTSNYFLWAKMMEGEALEGMESYQPAVDVYSSVIATTAGSRTADLEQIQTFALYHRARCYARLGDEQKALPSLVDAYGRRELLPRLVGEVELPLEMARNYSLMNLHQQSNEYEKISSVNLEKYLKEVPLQVAKRAEIYLQLGWKENLTPHSFEDLNFIQSDHQKNLYLLATIQTETRPYSQLALDNLMRTMNHYLQPLQAKSVSTVTDKMAFTELRKAYALELAETYREIELRLSPNTLRESHENMLVDFLVVYKSALLSVFKEQQLTSIMTEESEQLNSLRRGSSGRQKKRYMPPVTIDPNL